MSLAVPTDGLKAVGYNQSKNALERRSHGEVAQLVEHTTENRSVDSSILSLATKFLIHSRI